MNDGARNSNREDLEPLRRYVVVLEHATGGTTAQRIRCALETELTDRQRELTKLYYLEGLSQREIARQLGISDSAVSRTLLRARNRLRRSLRYGGRNLLNAMED